MAAPMLRGDRPPPSSLNTKWHPRSTSFFLERRPNWKEGASSRLERQRTKKKKKKGRATTIFIGEPGRRESGRQSRDSPMGGGGITVESRRFFSARTNMLFGNVVILQQKLNPSHYAQPTRSSPLAAAETSALLTFYPPSTLGRRLEFTHFKPSPQPNNSTEIPLPPFFFSARDKARSKDASGARDELAQIVSKRLVCLGYLGVFFFPPR